MYTESSFDHVLPKDQRSKIKPTAEHPQPPHKTDTLGKRMASPEEIAEALKMKPTSGATADLETAMHEANPFLGLDGEDVIHNMDAHGAVEIVNDEEERQAA